MNMPKELCFTEGKWSHMPEGVRISRKSLVLETNPDTDLWQRTYYGFCRDNAPRLLFNSDEMFTFSVKASFEYKHLFDQCGVILYLDSQNWFKGSIEYEDNSVSKLGSVVTYAGHSDWATSDIPTPTSMWYRLSQRGSDFLFEGSYDGFDFFQIRVFHFHSLGTSFFDPSDSIEPGSTLINFGIYACSPLKSSFQAKFTHPMLSPSIWKPYK